MPSATIWLPNCLAERYSAMRHFGEYIHAFKGTGHGIRHNLTACMRQADAVAAIAQRIEDIGANSAQQWHPVHHDTNLTTPGVIHALVGQLRVDPAQARRHGALNAAGLATGIIAAPAEQQPAVRGEPKIVDHFVLVTDREIQRVDLRRFRCAQRFRGHDIAAGGKHQARQHGGLQVLVGVAGQHHKIRPHTALRVS